MSSATNNPALEYNGQQAPLITLVSASGGVGKSTLALLLSQLCASQGINTALIEGDLQFGDMGFWLGIDVDSSNLSSGKSCVPVTISHNLDLYKAPVLPETAEEISESVAQLVPEIQTKYQLVFADTGQFWSGLTGELICSSALILLVMDQRKASAYGAIKALELCHRLGIPDARIVRVINKASGLSKTELERMQNLLDCETLHKLADGKAAIEPLISMGRLEELVETYTAPTHDAEQMLCALLPRVGIEFSQKPQKKTRRFFS